VLTTGIDIVTLAGAALDAVAAGGSAVAVARGALRTDETALAVLLINPLPTLGAVDVTDALGRAVSPA
jgi:hypothetical protein